MVRIATVGGVIAFAILSVFAGAASASNIYAPLGRPGPPLSVPVSQLEQSVSCHGALNGAVSEPVLLVSATAVDTEQNFGFGYEPLLAAHQIPYCTVDLPGEDAYNMGPIKKRADYLVYAIRYMASHARRKIAILGASQGGMVERWPLRFWPDTRTMVQDVISLDGPNHGTQVANALCATECAPALWDQTYQSHLIEALNSRKETLPGIDYTDIYTYTDDLVLPNEPGNSSTALSGSASHVTNVAVQEICPGQTVNHITLAASNPVAAALTLDAIAHRGPGSPARIGTAACSAPVFSMPGIEESTSLAGLQAAGIQVGTELATAPKTYGPPQLPCYVFEAPKPGTCEEE